MIYIFNDIERITFYIALNIKSKGGQQHQVKSIVESKQFLLVQELSNDSKKMALQKSLNINLYVVSFMSKVFLACVLGNFEKINLDFHGKWAF